MDSVNGVSLREGKETWFFRRLEEALNDDVHQLWTESISSILECDGFFNDGVANAKYILMSPTVMASRLPLGTMISRVVQDNGR